MNEEPPRKQWKDRPTVEIVILVWAMTVSIMLLATLVSVVVAKFKYPEQQFGTPAEIIANMVMGMIGYIAGKASANGGRNAPTG